MAEHEIGNVNYIVMADKRLFTKTIMVIAERTPVMEGSILDDVIQVNDLWGYWDAGSWCKDEGDLRSDKFCIQFIRVFKWDMGKFEKRMELMRRRMEWKYPGYKKYCKETLEFLAYEAMKRRG